MREWIEDAVGALCLFGLIYELALLGYGMGWQ